MPEIDTAAVPSVRARLAEIKLQEPQAAPAPPTLPRRPTAKPPAPPPLPSRTKTAPPAPPPRPPPTLPQRRPAPVLLQRRQEPTVPARSLPPAFTDVESRFSVKKPTEPHTAPAPLLPRKPTPTLPPRPTLSRPETSTRPPPPPAPAVAPRRLPPPASVTAPPPPPLPLASKPPPIPLSSKPDASTLITIPSGPTCLYHRDFSAADAHAASVAVIPNIPQLAFDLTSPFPSHTDKARVLFTFLHHHVSYDIDSYLHKSNSQYPSQEAADVLLRGSSVCQGYAALFEALASASGLEAAVVGGHGKGAGYTHGQRLTWPPSGHAWNAVRIDGGEWWLIDCCWGAGNVSLDEGKYTKEFKPDEFISPPPVFSKRHYPADERWALGGAWDWDAYQRDGGRAERPTCYLGLMERGFREDKVVPATKFVTGGEHVDFAVTWGKCEHDRDPGHDETWILFLKWGQGGDGQRAIMERCVDNKTWRKQLFVGRDWGKVQLCAITSMDGRDGRGLDDAWWNKIGRVGWSHGYMVEWTVG